VTEILRTLPRMIIWDIYRAQAEELVERFLDMGIAAKAVHMPGNRNADDTNGIINDEKTSDVRHGKLAKQSANGATGATASHDHINVNGLGATGHGSDQFHQVCH
jgi:hypothetical protein